jgi:hypothetical protein
MNGQSSDGQDSNVVILAERLSCFGYEDCVGTAGEERLETFKSIELTG